MERQARLGVSVGILVRELAKLAEIVMTNRHSSFETETTGAMLLAISQVFNTLDFVAA